MPLVPLASSRYEIREEIGRGAMGVVYAAYDRERGALVALKMLPRADGDLLYRMKTEFRALQGIYHPNLVRLGELVADGDTCFFTMELVRGLDFLSHVWGEDLHRANSTADTLVADSQAHSSADTLAADSQAHSSADTLAADSRARSTAEEIAADSQAHASADTLVADSQADSQADSSADTLVADSQADSSADTLAAGPLLIADVSAGEPRPRRACPARQARLRAALRQLAVGLVSLHDAGRVHRDLKPSNVLVTEDGRVVILDFGLAADLSLGLGAADPAEVAGTPAYMAPEQAAGGDITPAADWYSAGVMLYEALEGRLPVTGTVREVMAAKRRPPPPLSRATRAGFPDLAALCERLLAPDPERRPAGDAVVAALGGDAPAPLPAAGDGEPFVGREATLGQLSGALAACRGGACVVQVVAGPSGIGKSALARAFLRDAETNERAVVLPARCYEREAVRYKALDGAVDSLSRYLRTLSPARREALWPEDAAPLARLFPVLERVPGFPVADGARAFGGAELRLRAFAALRALLSRIAGEVPVVLFIDDIQWADADSFALLRELARPPGAPALLILATLRHADGGRGAGPISWLEDGLGAELRRLDLGPLPERDAEALARRLAISQNGHTLPHRIAREAGGHPLLLHQLARSRGYGSEGSGDMSLDELLRASALELPREARAVLELLAVAGQPLARRVVAKAIDLDRLALEQTLERLEARHLARSMPLGGDLGVEPFHARVRDVVSGDLTARERTSLHRLIAGALEAVGGGDSETLAHHWLEAGERGRAAGHAARAAREASAALAFDRSARLYELALELTAAPAERRDLHAGLAQALVGLGRSSEAARSYLAASEGAPPDAMLEHKRRAAEHLLTSGRVDEGLAVIDDVLAAVGMRRRPRTAASALAAIARARARTHVLARRPRAAPRSRRHDLVGVDACWSAWMGLAMIDPLGSTVFLARHNELAFSSADPRRVARARSLEATLLCRHGPRAGHRPAALHAAAREAVRDIDDPGLNAFLEMQRGTRHFAQAQWSAALAAFARAEALYEHCASSAWETDNLHLYRLYAWGLVGEFREIAARGPAVLRDAYARDDRFFATALRCGVLPWSAILRGEAAQARRDVNDALREWGRKLDVPHAWSILTRAATHLYEEDGRSALDLLARAIPRMRRNGLLGVHVLRVPLRHHRACAAVAAAASARGLEKRRLVALAWRDARALARERAAWTRGLSLLIRAGAFATGGEAHRARPLLEGALTAFEAAEMGHFVAAVKARLGEVTGGDAGAAHRAGADAWAASQNARDPERLWNLWAPGFR